MAVDMLEANFTRIVGGKVNDVVRRRRNMREFIRREKFGDMPGAIGTEIVTNPLGYLFELLRIIVFTGYHVSPSFNMNSEFLRFLNRA